MALTWLDPAHVDERDLAGVVALLELIRAADTPYEPQPTVASFRTRILNGWDGEPSEVAIERDEAGRVIGMLEAHLPQRDNTHMGYIEVAVDPDLRRQGIGRRLFELGVQRCRDGGRRLVMSGSLDSPAGNGFLTAMGLTRASTGINRFQDLPAVDWPHLQKEHEEARRRSEGYDLVRILGALPDDMLEQAAVMTAAINDAPTDDLDIEDEIFTPERVRAFDTAQLNRDRRLYRVMARERGTGDLAGHTVVAVEADRPWYGSQFDTSVLSAHRGHRLGMALKAEMLLWLREAEPQLRTLSTWNAASNAHMIAVNEALGYYVVSTGGEWQRNL